MSPSASAKISWISCLECECIARNFDSFHSMLLPLPAVFWVRKPHKHRSSQIKMCPGSVEVKACPCQYRGNKV